MSTANNQSTRQINTAALRGTSKAHQPDEIYIEGDDCEKIAKALFDGEPRDKFDAAARNSFLDAVIELMRQRGGKFCEVR